MRAFERASATSRRAGHCNACFTGKLPRLEIRSRAGRKHVHVGTSVSSGVADAVTADPYAAAGRRHRRGRRGGRPHRSRTCSAHDAAGGAWRGSAGSRGAFALSARPAGASRCSSTRDRRRRHQADASRMRLGATTPSASTWSRCASTTSRAPAPSRCSSSTTSRPARSTRRASPSGRRAASPTAARRPAARCVGGETAELPGLVRAGRRTTSPASRSASSSATSCSDGSDVRAGDVVDRPRVERPALQRLLARARGAARGAPELTPLDEHARAACGRALGEELLEPTRIYVRTLRRAGAPTCRCARAAHITGGGLPRTCRACSPTAGARASTSTRVAPAGDLRRDPPARRDRRCTRCTASSTWASAWCSSSLRSDAADAVVARPRRRGEHAWHVGQVDRRPDAGGRRAGGRRRCVTFADCLAIGHRHRTRRPCWRPRAAASIPVRRRVRRVRPSRRAGLRARRSGAASTVLVDRPRRFATATRYERAIVDALRDARRRARRARRATCASAGRSSSRAFEGRTLNMHPSLLPAFPGRDAIGARARRGVSTHRRDRALDRRRRRHRARHRAAGRVP